ncbi:hypothetical protein DYB32_007889 [Aphanomyces invadans]|uniref:Uncharacterized protein n=1 Tax=Aphanomyces invadans TaxID=157072 RepID=A0A3R6WHJ2_9STRA|nr:hypothetical protein DYB32_007889 [Aphanomyces invadans]
MPHHPPCWNSPVAKLGSRHGGLHLPKNLAKMLSDRVFVEATNDQVEVTMRVYYTPARVAFLVAIGTAIAFGMLTMFSMPLPLFVVGICVASTASMTVFVGVQWLLYGFERFTLAGAVLTYEWGIPGTGLGGSAKFDTATMGPIQINANGALGFTYQGRVIRIGKVCRSHEKVEFLDALAARLPAYLVSYPPVAQCDRYYPVDGKTAAVPSTAAVPCQSQSSLAPIRMTVTPAEAHI